MKREDKQLVNDIVMAEYTQAMSEFHSAKDLQFRRLRTCSAWVCETENYWFLTSYHTLVAFINKEQDTLYDVLRKVYGYTSTSAQHISKFGQDYGKSKYGCEYKLRYYPL